MTRLDDEIQTLERRLARSPRDADALRLMARLVEVHARREDARALVEVLKRIRQLDPSWRPALEI